jgi:hypothetical protein
MQSDTRYQPDGPQHKCQGGFAYYSRLFTNYNRAVILPTGKKLGYRLDEARIPAVARDFSLFHTVQTGFGAHLVSYAMGTASYFLGARGAEASN